MQIMETATQESVGPLAVGTVVVVFGLVAARELNGSEGVVEGFDGR